MSHFRNTPTGASDITHLEVKDAHVHSIRRLTVGQEGPVVEDAAHRPVRGGRFGLGGQGRSFWVNGSVQVSAQTTSVVTASFSCSLRANQSWNMSHNPPLCRQTFPEGDGSVTAAGQDPGVRHPLGVGAHAHVGVQAEAQQEAAQQGGVILAVALQTQPESASDATRTLVRPRKAGGSSVNHPTLSKFLITHN